MGLAALPMTPLRKPWSFPPHGLALFEGDRETPRLSHYFLPSLILKGKRILLLDGANCASPRLMARLAQRRGIPFEEFNSHIRIARAFTCFQLTELIARVPQFMADFKAHALILTAFPELYLDQDIRDWDARVAFGSALEDLRQWASHVKPSLVVAVFSSAAGFAPPYSRRNFMERTRMAATEVWRFGHDEQGKLSWSLQPSFCQQGDTSLGTIEDKRARCGMTKGADHRENELKGPAAIAG